MRLSLYERLKPEHKQKLTEHYANYKHSREEIVEVLSNEYFFTQVRYGIAADIEFVCDLKFFGDAFNE